MNAIRITWPSWDQSLLAEVTEKRLAAWLVDHRTRYSATRTNGAVTVLRELLAIALRDKELPRQQMDGVSHGLKFVSVDYDYKRLPLELSEPAEVVKLRDEIYLRCKLRGTLGGYFFESLLFCGMRIASAGAVLREDVHRAKGLLYVRTAKYGPYTIPLFADLLETVERIERNIPGGAKDKLLPTKSLQSVSTSACNHLKLPHLTHHDLRHIFATRFIEAGVDIPTLASWLGNTRSAAEPSCKSMGICGTHTVRHSRRP